MKIILALALLAVLALAQDAKPLTITTLDGAEYKGVTVTRVTADAISITHDDGTASIPLANLTPEMQKRFNYDPKAAAAALAARAAAKAAADARATVARGQTAASETGMRELAAKQATAEAVRCDVIAVHEDGAVVVPLQAHAVGGGLGAGSAPATSFRRGSKTVFLSGIKGVAEDQRLQVYAYQAGTHTFTAANGGSRTLENWVFVRMAAKK